MWRALRNVRVVVELPEARASSPDEHCHLASISPQRQRTTSAARHVLAASLTLDAGGDANAVWVFQTQPGSLNVGLTGPAAPAVPIGVLLVNGAQAKNVFWHVPAGAVIGTGSTMTGTLLADASITFSTTGGSPPTAPVTTLNGRAIALTAAVTMTNTVINVPAP